MCREKIELTLPTYEDRLFLGKTVSEMMLKKVDGFQNSLKDQNIIYAMQSQYKRL